MGRQSPHGTQRHHRRGYVRQAAATSPESISRQTRLGSAVRALERSARAKAVSSGITAPSQTASAYSTRAGAGRAPPPSR